MLGELLFCKLLNCILTTSDGKIEILGFKISAKEKFELKKTIIKKKDLKILNLTIL